MSNPLFIVGTGRSGTTLLRAMLNAHPELHLSKESSFFLETSSRRFQRHPEVELERYFRSAPFLWLKLSSSSVRALLPANPVRSDVFRAVLQADAQRYHKSAWGDKTPAHWLCIDEIYQSFPHAVVIHLIRDPRQVVASLLRMPWGSPSVLGNTFYYERCVSTLLADPRVKHFQFEELHHHPRPILEQILQWVELPWSEQLLNHSQYSTNDVGGIPWLVKAYQPLTLQKHSPSLPPAIEAWVERLCPSVMDKYYERRHQKTSLKPVFSDFPALIFSIIHMLRLNLLPPKYGKEELWRWLKHNQQAFIFWPGWDIEKVIEASFTEKNIFN